VGPAALVWLLAAEAEPAFVEAAVPALPALLPGEPELAALVDDKPAVEAAPALPPVKAALGGARSGEFEEQA
jgi:hypothetical protein